MGKTEISFEKSFIKLVFFSMFSLSSAPNFNSVRVISEMKQLSKPPICFIFAPILYLFLKKNMQMSVSSKYFFYITSLIKWKESTASHYYMKFRFPFHFNQKGGIMHEKTVIHTKLTPVRFAPLFIDWTFKKVFGKKNIRYLPTELLGATPKSKKVIFDILCEDSESNTYLLEMQNAKLKTAGDRIRLYLARIQSEDIDRGAKNYRLPSSFFIGILNYKRDDSKFYFTEEGWLNLQTKELANKKEFKVFIELPKFDKPADKCRSFRDKIIFLFKNLHLIKERPANFKEKIFDRIFSIAEISKLEGRDLKSFRYSMRYVDERQLAIDCAVEEATEAAIVQGLRQGVKRGVKQGILRTAKNMLKEGLKPALVARITNLPKEEILALR